MKKLFLFLIRFYQRSISPAFPPCCRFQPTCSAYAYEAIEADFSQLTEAYLTLAKKAGILL